MILNKSIPFSESFDTANQNSNSGILFILMLFVPVFAGLHFVSTLVPFGPFIYLVVALIALLLLWKPAFTLTWEKISD
jgi:ABC-2 type transport system permease protein